MTDMDTRLRMAISMAVLTIAGSRVMEMPKKRSLSNKSVIAVPQITPRLRQRVSDFTQTFGDPPAFDGGAGCEGYDMRGRAGARL